MLVIRCSGQEEEILWQSTYEAFLLLSPTHTQKAAQQFADI